MCINIIINLMLIGEYGDTKKKTKNEYPRNYLES